MIPGISTGGGGLSGGSSSSGDASGSSANQQTFNFAPPQYLTQSAETQTTTLYVAGAIALIAVVYFMTKK